MLIYFFVRLFGFFVRLLPYSAIHALGRISGSMLYYLYTPFRKKAMNNLAVAYENELSEKERKLIAKRTFRNLVITCLEFFRLDKKHLDDLILSSNEQIVADLYKKKQGMVFFSGHQANWEIPFLAVTNNCGPGIAIGRPIKNKRLYNWVLGVREMCGGKIVMPKNALKEGLKALRRGEFIGIVGDQALPESDYSYPLFGTRAWTTTAPALLAYKTNSPLIVALTKRIKSRYQVHVCDPIWPDKSKPVKEEVPRMMDEALLRFEKSIREQPDQWMWVHDRWKQQGVDHVKREYRYGFVAIIAPKNCDPELFELLKRIYPRSFLTIYCPDPVDIEAKVIHYNDPSELFVRDWKQQLLLDFVGLPKLRRHYMRLGAVRAIELPVDLNFVSETLVKCDCQDVVKKEKTS
ncbi:MAG: Lipid A biosynthesis lauroyltransferase [Chlamydiales bacterium]|nr:Lipid A biosynthesis lauroyltransferase [Chlamydiales bacterium]MCH9635757.1 Lipid A biosynthesis lauroyltransferase [Chlamydiales bacterium]MCH9703209.1 hypothetical protein [Chlamydiota bacterium]